LIFSFLIDKGKLVAAKCPKCHFENPDTQKFCGECGFALPDSSRIDFSRTETIQAPLRELTTGSTFAGRYQIIEELGKGGMGRVYKVYDTKIKEKVALKLIKPEIASDRETVERFANEIKLARRIRQKNICGMYDLGEAEGAHFITMEFVAGEDLKSMIRMSGELSPATAIHLASEICQGLVEAHRLGVIHRDLKPQNIMIDREGNPRIMDFGIARSLRGRGITGPGVMIGTPEYMSPEQVEGKEADARSDIYSLGIMLYEMLTGRVPFEGDTPFAVALKQESELPRDPRELNARIPEDLSGLILKCLEKEKERRYSGASEVLDELSRIEKEFPAADKEVPKRKTFTSKEITVKFNVRKILFPAIIMVAVAAAAVFFLLLRKPAPSLDPKLTLVSIFENHTGDETLDPLGRVAAYEIAQGLSQMGIVEVVPTMSVLQSSRIINAETGVPKGADELRALAEGTGAGTLVSGAYDLIDHELHFHATVTDVAHGKLIQSLEALKGSLDDKMILIIELRQRIMGALAMHFTSATMSELSLKARRPPVYEAYQEFLQGLDLFGVDYEKSMRHFARAVELDPTFATAKLYIAVAYGNLGQYEKADSLLQLIFQSRDELAPLENRLLDWYSTELKGQTREALRFAREAENLAPNNTSINYIVGYLEKDINHPRETIKVYAKMDSLDPKILYGRLASSWRISVLAEAHHMLEDYKKELEVVKRGMEYYPQRQRFRAIEVRALAALGKTDEVRKVIEECLSMESTGGTPGDVMMEAALELYAHGDKDASREILAGTIEWFENRPEDEKKTEDYQISLADTFYFSGQWEDAKRIIETLAAEYPDNIDYKGFLGVLAARREDRAEAIEISDELAAIDQPFLFGNHTYWRACIASLLGEKERALTLLKEAFNQGRTYGISLHRDINLESLRDYPPFIEFLRPKG
jgi:serine/threonine protein kinase/tetratricopeptide (TPR) repeat protein